MRRAPGGLLLLLPLLAIAQQTPDAYLARFDRNGDHRIDVREYVAYMSRGFRALDADGDGRLQGAELPPGPRRAPRTLAAFQADLRRAFRRLDRNHDGALTAAELARPPSG